MGSQTENPRGQICTLVYQEHESFGSEPVSETAFLVAKKQQSEGLSLFVNPAWREFVASRHWEYMDDLLEDFKERKRFEPDALFQQLCSLRVGPIITHEVHLLDVDTQQHIPSNFTELK